MIPNPKGQKEEEREDMIMINTTVTSIDSRHECVKGEESKGTSCESTGEESLSDTRRNRTCCQLSVVNTFVPASHV